MVTNKLFNKSIIFCLGRITIMLSYTNLFSFGFLNLYLCSHLNRRKNISIALMHPTLNQYHSVLRKKIQGVVLEQLTINRAPLLPTLPPLLSTPMLTVLPDSIVCLFGTFKENIGLSTVIENSTESWKGFLKSTLPDPLINIGPCGCGG